MRPQKEKKVWSQLQEMPVLLTIPANCETSMKNDKIAATIPVANVLLTGTWVHLLTSEKKDGSNPSLAIAIRIRGWKHTIKDINIK